MDLEIYVNYAHLYILNNIKEIQDTEEKDKTEQDKRPSYNPTKMASNMMGNMATTMPKMNLPKF
jgi:hypothetical protein